MVCLACGSLKHSTFIVTVCPAGSYEPSCKAICNCLANMPCDLMTGACTNQLCKSGWTGGTCNEGSVRYVHVDTISLGYNANKADIHVCMIRLIKLMQLFGERWEATKRHHVPFIF